MRASRPRAPSPPPSSASGCRSARSSRKRISRSDTARDCRSGQALLRSEAGGGDSPLTREQRRLAAIVAADVVGYSRLMGHDESGTLARLREHRKQRFEPSLASHGGRLVKLTGDGALAEFGSAVDALGAAIEFQQAMAEANRDQSDDTAIVFRIGVHLGDLIV